MKEFLDNVLEVFEARVLKDDNFSYTATSPHVDIFGIGKSKRAALGDLFEQICFRYVDLRFCPIPLGEDEQKELVTLHRLLKESGVDRLEEIEEEGGF